MNTTELVPYFHPTQIVLVDDDIDFLGNLSLQLEADLAYLLFDSTHKALSYINDRHAQEAPRQRFFRIADDVRPPVAGDGDTPRPRVTLDTDALLREMHFTNRFSRISVAMVDYAMPQMNGLEFCRRIENPYIKKILFTGVATEADAVDAFNQGVIDRYIRKSEHQVYDNLNRTIRELQYAHIRDAFVAAGEVFDVDKPSLLSDPAIASLVQTLLAEHGFVEYYLCANPWGFLMVDGDGRLHRLVLHTRTNLKQEAQRARFAGAPKDCVDALAKARIVLDPAIKGDQYGHWSRHVRAPERINGQQEYFWALFEANLEQGETGPPASTYNRYLEWLDTVGYSMM